MDEKTLQGIRSLASTVIEAGGWEVVVETKFGTSCKAFGLTEERARDWARWYKGGVARMMKGST